MEDRFCRFNKWEPINKSWDDDKGMFIYKEKEKVDDKYQLVEKTRAHYGKTRGIRTLPH